MKNKNKLKKLAVLSLTVVILSQFSIISFAVDAEEIKNPDLYALAKEYGYESDTFQFTNFVPDERLSDEVYDEAFERALDLLSKPEEESSCKVPLSLSTMGGCCYGMSAIPVLIHNNVITADDLQEGAVSLNDVVFDDKVGKHILSYSFSQVYHKVTLANLQSHCINTNEERVAELLLLAKRCQERNRYFQIAYQGIIEDRIFSHAVVGIGVAEGSWTFDNTNYDNCILTYDSNRANAEDTSVAGKFTEDLCIYINSKTNQFCIPGYGVTSENKGCILYASDAVNRFTYRSEINGTDDIGEDISNISQVNSYGKALGVETTALKNDGEWVNIDGLLKSEFLNQWGQPFFIYPSTTYHFDQSHAADYIGEDTGIYGRIWGDDFCSRYGASKNYNYAIDASPNMVSVENKGSVYETDTEEMVLTCSLTFNGNYFYFMGTASEGEIVTMKREGNGVIISSSDGSLKGTILLNDASNTDYGIAANDSVYIDPSNSMITVYLDKDNDGIYESPLEQGDVNGDGKISIDDAIDVLSYYAKSAAQLTYGQVGLNKTYPLSLNTADMNGDGKIDIEDATAILTKYARRAAGLE